jgi:nucleoside-diphosphate-sugar epimerase
LNELVHLLNVAFGTQIEPVYQAERFRDIQHSCADTTKSEELLGFYNVVPIREGLVKTVRWFSETSGRSEKRKN